jgi:hypothetical protein
MICGGSLARRFANGGVGAQFFRVKAKELTTGTARPIQLTQSFVSPLELSLPIMTQ